MHYDPIKRTLGSVFNTSPFMRKLFYALLDLLLLRAWHVHRELKLWRKGKGDDIKILDAGSGYGQHSYYLAGMNPKWEILAVDVKQEQVEDCNKFFQQVDRTNVKFEVADLTKFDMPERFDMALSVDVMEHILEDVAVFENICKSLKPGGMLLVSTPSDQGGSDVHDDGESSFIEEHVRDGYNIKEIEDKMKKAGFSKVEALYSYGTPGKISWRLSMKWPIQMVGASKIFLILLPLYFLITYPFAYLLNWMDVSSKHATGTGLIVKAWK
ncbi:MAG: class I SAM-dependent methyltransferase [Bacteroidetes bacterium]|jgi:SAM-dependent methyltransferase|nr:class I SAM-dependent methyltransferase [Bacteroidota bacterium]